MRRPAAPARVLLALVAVTAALLLPAIYNGFPLVFSDTGEYLMWAVTLQVPAYRTIGYSLWIAIMGRGTTIWVPVVVQSALLAAMLLLLVRTLVPRLPARAVLGGTLVIAMLTAASSRASQVMPDVFAPIMVLALYLAVAQRHRLGRAERWVVGVALASSVIMHATHVALAAGLFVCFSLVALRSPATARRHWRGFVHAALAVSAGLGLLLTINFAQTRRLFVSQNGHVFLLAHLVESGLATRLLADECPRVHYQLCAYQDGLGHDGPWNTPDAFVWNHESPFHRIGGWEGSREETSRILRGTLRRYPLRHLLVALDYSARELGAVWTLDGLHSYGAVAYVQDGIAGRWPADLARFRAARQQRRTLGLVWLAQLHELVILLSSLASLWLLCRVLRAARPVSLGTSVGFHVTVWLVLIGNAVLCANLSGVYDRYQSRLAWLVPLAVLLSVAERRWGRRVTAHIGRDAADSRMVARSLPELVGAA